MAERTDAQVKIAKLIDYLEKGGTPKLERVKAKARRVAKALDLGKDDLADILEEFAEAREDREADRD